MPKAFVQMIVSMCDGGLFIFSLDTFVRATHLVRCEECLRLLIAMISIRLYLRSFFDPFAKALSNNNQIDVGITVRTFTSPSHKSSPLLILTREDRERIQLWNIVMNFIRWVLKKSSAFAHPLGAISRNCCEISRSCCPSSQWMRTRNPSTVTIRCRSPLRCSVLSQTVAAATWTGVLWGCEHRFACKEFRRPAQSPSSATCRHIGEWTWADPRKTLEMFLTFTRSVRFCEKDLTGQLRHRSDGGKVTAWMSLVFGYNLYLSTLCVFGSCFNGLLVRALPRHLRSDRVENCHQSKHGGDNYCS